MKLDIFLFAESITYSEFARRIGAANAGVVHRYASGKRVPRPKYMAAIIRETAGKVQPNDFFSSSRDIVGDGGSPPSCCAEAGGPQQVEA